LIFVQAGIRRARRLCGDTRVKLLLMTRQSGRKNARSISKSLKQNLKI